MNRLLSQKYFEVCYVKIFIVREKMLYPDFTVHNTKTNIIFYWEHFGLSEDARYMEKMAEKIKLYKEFGLTNIEEGGCFIGTIFKEESHFTKLVDDFIEKIKAIVPAGVV
ncbi:hypothetical protein GGR21_001319 [Dysgonomonas hofstadii]|uniref:Uncharacterized protein n=1 Tax=Dysgonomonas hofstadii TaxID=637886 RepID=A0A840CJA2_9BACT|nr:hypothetical protein [Dysgonomonas hofstadii]MBB4035426.1 hypothetical protein [Dysgonomonas hofstadii]